MSVIYDREEFRKYLQDSGVVSALSRVFLKLYELKEARPKLEATIKFIQDHLADKSPSLLEFETLKDDMNTLRILLGELKADGKFTSAQLAVINRICSESYVTAGRSGKSKDDSLMAVRQSQLDIGNEIKKSNKVESKIRQMIKTNIDHDKLKVTITDLKGKSNCHSLLKTHITIAMYEKYSVSFAECICSGLDIPESMIGVYSVAADAYDVFEDLFNPVIQEFHSFDKTTAKHPPSAWGDPATLPDLDPKNKYILSTRIRCIRNVDGYPFVPKMDEAQLKESCEKIKNAFLVAFSTDADLKGTWYDVATMDAAKKKEFIDSGYILEFGDKFLESAGATEFWPNNRAIYINDKKTFFAWINEEDHLRLISIEAGNNIPHIYGQLKKSIELCQKQLQFATHPQYGFLTLCPTNLGNTIRASVMIELPKLSKKKKELDALIKASNLELRGGEKGAPFEISNKRKLGLNEYQSLQELYIGIEAIIKKEQTL